MNFSGINEKNLVIVYLFNWIYKKKTDKVLGGCRIASEFLMPLNEFEKSAKYFNDFWNPHFEFKENEIPPFGIIWGSCSANFVKTEQKLNE